MAKGTAKDQKNVMIQHLMTCKKKGCTVCGS